MLDVAAALTTALTLRVAVASEIKNASTGSVSIFCSSRIGLENNIGDMLLIIKIQSKQCSLFHEEINWLLLLNQNFQSNQ